MNPGAPRLRRWLTNPYPGDSMVLVLSILSVLAGPTVQSDEFNWHRALAAGKRIEIVGVNGQIIFESGQPHHFAGERWRPASGEPGRFLRYEGAKA